VDEVTWLPVRTAMSRLTYAHDHFLVAQFLEQPATTPLIIVRHAKAMDRKDWSRKDSARPVNSRGRRQAQLLVPMLSAYGVQRVISSTSTRCVSTMEPYARRRDLRIETYSQLSEEVGADDAKGVSRLMQKVRGSMLQGGQPTVVCVHRPVLPHILDALEMAPTTLVTGEFLVAHLTADGEVHALERHRPLA
jgi:8-oxo-dGTP diphosphatase